MKRPRRRLLAPVVVVILLAWLLAHAGTALVVSHPLESPDAIVMLASHEWERLPATAALARQHPDALVLLTVPRVITEHNCHLCTDRPAWLAAEGVDGSRVRLLPRRVMNTYEEAQAAWAYATEHGLDSLLVVTSPYHTRRAWATFAHVFHRTPIRLGIAPAQGAQGRPERWWMTKFDRYYVAYEWAANLKYRWDYGVKPNVLCERSGIRLEDLLSPKKETFVSRHVHPNGFVVASASHFV